MKKTIIIMIIVGMFSWAIYDLLGKSNDKETTRTNEYEISEETSTITSNEEMLDFDSIGLQVGDKAPDLN